MACHGPLPGWLHRDKTARKLRAVTFRKEDALIDRPINIPCGKCLGCRIDKAQQWALRCSHEAQCWPSNLFVTLTYDDYNLPHNEHGPTLRPRDFVLFMKRLRKTRPSDTIRFFQCGEYGTTTLRPHHHALLFNLAFPDRQRCRKSGNYHLYRSEELELLWQQGKAEFGEVNYKTAAYVSKYTCKPHITPRGAEPEYQTMSRRPGIGRLWLDKFIADVYPSDQCVTSTGNILKPPRYYDDQLAVSNPATLQRIRAQRFAKLLQLSERENLPRRLSARAIIQRNQLKERT